MSCSRGIALVNRQRQVAHPIQLDHSLFFSFFSSSFIEKRKQDYAESLQRIFLLHRLSKINIINMHKYTCFTLVSLLSKVLRRKIRSFSLLKCQMKHLIIS